MAAAVARLAFAVASLPLAFACLYLLALTLLSRRPLRPAQASQRLRFDLVVPAHDEAQVIARLVDSLRRIDWPQDRYRILVICDNCHDATASLARAAGAATLERTDPQRRGKGYALQFGFAASLRQGFADAVAVIDADSVVSPNLLQACAARLEGGAHAMQVDYGVLNPQASTRTRLMALAFACIHRIRSRARERVGLSCGIRGNGWCLSREALHRVPYRAFSLAEDVEYGIDLGLAGLRVHYVDEAWVRGEMVSDEYAARSQRRRWEGGRLALVRARMAALLSAALRRRSAVCLDLAIDLLLPPLSWLAAAVLALLPPAALGVALDPALAPWLWLDCGCAAALSAYVLRGWQLSGLGASGLKDLLHAPAFVLWKLRLMLSTGTGNEWVRTRRERR